MLIQERKGARVFLKYLYICSYNVYFEITKYTGLYVEIRLFINYVLG